MACSSYCRITDFFWYDIPYLNLLSINHNLRIRSFNDLIILFSVASFLRTCMPLLNLSSIRRNFTFRIASLHISGCIFKSKGFHTALLGNCVMHHLHWLEELQSYRNLQLASSDLAEYSERFLLFIFEQCICSSRDPNHWSPCNILQCLSFSLLIRKDIICSYHRDSYLRKC